ncbi:MAG: CoA transferase [Coriobacteriales bacterium]|jgi:L-carnitine CoA-transferase|nr:CoA transferase [Coriobacteriales bacterium]
MKASEIPAFGPLQGIRVVNLTQAIAGPFACGMLADLGAEVIGVESPRGRDTSRPGPGRGGWGTQMERRNSRALCLNVTDGKGREVFYDLLQTTDILVEGFRGGQLLKWGMSDEVLWEINPKLVIVHISGFGQTGNPSYVKRSSFDGIGQAYGCFMEMNGYPDRLPVLAFPQVSDYYAGFMAITGALSGYIRAQITGKGESVDVAQYESMLRCEGFYAVNYLNTGALPVREGSHSTSSAGYGTYLCKDGVPIYTLILGAGVVKSAVLMLGLEYGNELFPEGIAGIPSTFDAAPVLEDALKNFFASVSADEAERTCLDHGIPCSRIYTFPMAEADPHYLARESFTEWHNSFDENTIRGINIVPKLKNNPGKIWRGMPLVGHDNEDILEELGYSCEDITALYDAGLLKREQTING